MARLRYMLIHDDDGGPGDDQRQTRITIGDTGIEIDHLPGPVEAIQDKLPSPSSRVIERAEALAGSGIHIYTGLDQDARTTQTLFGMGMVLGGIALFLLSLVVTRYTLIGIRRYIAMNISLLKGH